MNGNSIIEMYTTLFGWMMYNKIWDVLNDTGLVYIPFIFMFILSYRRLKTGGSHRGIREFSNAIRIEIIMSMVVLTIFSLPIVPVTIGNMSSSRVSVECGSPSSSLTPATDPSTFSSSGAFAALGGNTFYMPVGWALWQSLAGGISAATVAGIPCSGDLRGFQLSASNQVVQDPAARREVSDFVQQCYAPSVALAQQNSLTTLSADDLGWLGSPTLMGDPLYNTPISTPRADFAYDPVRDDGYGNNGMGHPTCSQWWNGVGVNAGLRSRLVQQLDPVVLAQAKSAAAGGMRAIFGGGATDTQIEDDLLRSMLTVSDRQPLEEGAQLNNDYSNAPNVAGRNGFFGEGNVFTSAVGLFGSAFSGVSHFPKMMMVREALPIAKAFLVMVIIALMPFILVLSCFNPAVVATIAVALLGVQVFDLLWAMSYWMDNMLVKTLLSDTSMFFGWLNHPQTTMVMDFVTSVLCIFLPMVWLAMLGWIGVQTFGFMQGATEGLINPAGQAGATGGGAVVGAAGKGASAISSGAAGAK